MIRLGLLLVFTEQNQLVRTHYGTSCPKRTHTHALSYWHKKVKLSQRGDALWLPVCSLNFFSPRFTPSLTLIFTRLFPSLSSAQLIWIKTASCRSVDATENNCRKVKRAVRNTAGSLVSLLIGCDRIKNVLSESLHQAIISTPVCGGRIWLNVSRTSTFSSSPLVMHSDEAKTSPPIFHMFRLHPMGGKNPTKSNSESYGISCLRVHWASFQRENNTTYWSIIE